MADIFLGSLEMPLKQHSDLVTEAFNYRGNSSSYLIHSLAFSFIIKLSSIILPIYTLSQACAGAINISMVFFVCVYMWKRNAVCLCAPSWAAAIKTKTGMLCLYLSVEWEHVRSSQGKSVYHTTCHFIRYTSTLLYWQHFTFIWL